MPDESKINIFIYIDNLNLSLPMALVVLIVALLSDTSDCSIVTNFMTIMTRNKMLMTTLNIQGNL